ncbi:hypothetical protein Aduo_008878 [Ancylostoma duodenale]
MATGVGNGVRKFERFAGGDHSAARRDDSERRCDSTAPVGRADASSGVCQLEQASLTTCATHAGPPAFVARIHEEHDRLVLRQNGP